MRIIITLLFALALQTQVFAQPSVSSASLYRVPPNLNDGWKTGRADSLGVDSKQFASLTQSIRAWPELGVHAILIERRGRLIYEEYFDGFDERYFWWYSCYPTPRGLIEARTAVGNRQQRIFVLKGLDMVVTIFAGRYNDFTTGATLSTRILREHILPAVRTGIRPGCPGA